jgi:hypothetical protein
MNIDRIEEKFHVSYFGGDLSIEFQFRDIEGTVRNASITSFAIRDLVEKLHDSTEILLDRSVPGGKSLGFTVTTGPTRGEVYGVEGEL